MVKFSFRFSGTRVEPSRFLIAEVMVVRFRLG